MCLASGGLSTKAKWRCLHGNRHSVRGKQSPCSSQGFFRTQRHKPAGVLMLEGRVALRNGGAVVGELGLADRMLRHFLELVQLLRESW